MSITPKNWTSFQHYKDRSPSWIKLHRGLLDDFAFARLPVASRALAPILWLLASEYEDGAITASNEELAFRLRMSLVELEDALSPLVSAGFFNASEMLAERKQDACLEKRREREEKETDSPPVAKATRPASRFAEFWAEYPKRDGDNPRSAAEKKFEALVKSGVDPQSLIDGAKQSSADYRRRGNFGTQYVPQAVKWLNDKRWIDAAASAFAGQAAGAAASTKYYAKDGSEQLQAWDEYRLRTAGKRYPRDSKQGWLVDAEWPPGYVPPDRLERPPDMPQMRSMN